MCSEIMENAVKGSGAKRAFPGECEQPVEVVVDPTHVQSMQD